MNSNDTLTWTFITCVSPQYDLLSCPPEGVKGDTKRKSVAGPVDGHGIKKEKKIHSNFRWSIQSRESNVVCAAILSLAVFDVP